MYHIKSDKRSRTSAKLICDAMLRCLDEKPFSEITIVDLQKESTVDVLLFIVCSTVRKTFWNIFMSSVSRKSTMDIIFYPKTNARLSRFIS